MPAANEVDLSGDPGHRFRVSDQVLFEALPTGEVVCLHLGTEEYFGLDPVGARCLALLSELGSIDEAERQLALEYDVEPSDLRGDLEDLVSQLQRDGLIEFDAV
jgi:hypothetical protein